MIINYFWDFFNQYGLIIIFLFIFLEYACFPLPSEVILPIAGAYAFSNNINVFYIILGSVIFGSLGSLLCYYIGVSGNYFIISKIKSKKFKELNSSLDNINKYGAFSICLSRLIPLCRTYISFVAGIKKYNFPKYIIYTAIGILIWNSLLILLGYNFFNNLDLIIEIYNKYTIIILSIILLIIIIYFIYRMMRYRHERKNNKNKCNAHS